jgi:hypothetical protein
LDDPEKLVIENGRGFYRPAGPVSFAQGVAQIRAAIAEACARGGRDLLVDTTQLTGFDLPTDEERIAAVTGWADAARGRLHLAIVARPEVIHPERIGVSVGINRQLFNNIFTTEAGAIAFLDGLMGSWWESR